MAKELTRRSFLKATLATTGTISIGAMNIPFAAAEDPLKPVSASDYVAVPPAFVPNGKDTTYVWHMAEAPGRKGVFRFRRSISTVPAFENR